MAPSSRQIKSYLSYLFPKGSLLGLPGLILALFTLGSALPATAAGNGCTAKGCHAGIMEIVPGNLPMAGLIRQNGMRHKDMDGCVVCHGGNPSAPDKDKAHRGIPKSLTRAPGPKAFYPNPGDIRIATNTCGVCHPGYVYRVRRSLMNTGAGKIQGNLSAWGTRQDYGVIWGNHDLDDPDGPVPSGTTLAYEAYMAELRQALPGPFPDKLDRLPLPSMQEVEADPAQAAFIYQRRQCQHCHINVKGPQIRGNFRGTGCSACHMKYGTEGVYQGNDQSIPKTPGHIQTHRIAGNRKTLGIAVATCAACHNRGKQIGISFSGKMTSPFPGPFAPDGSTSPGLHGTNYIPVQEDLHHRQQSRKGNPEGGLLCQDCHTSMDVHGDGNIQGTTLAQVEIECTDCHGTPDKYPWELPLGLGDEFGVGHENKNPRGTSENRLLSGQQFGFDYDKADGYILSARGNPLGNAVRQGSRVLVHSATGKDFYVPVLKALPPEEKNAKASLAMSAVAVHLEKMECYTCHAAWTPQRYGNYIKMDFQAPGGIDWIKVSNGRPASGSEPAPKQDLTLPGTIEESTGYLRWETPVLGINGEGRISPLAPAGQVAATVISRTGQVIAAGRMARNPVEAVAAGQDHIPLALDMAPLQPHTLDPHARSCESCHTDAKTPGLGIGRFKTLESLAFDWSCIVDSNGTQVATVGTHWPASRAFNKKELDRILRTGTCAGCHNLQNLPEIRKKLSDLKAETPENHAGIMEIMIRKYERQKGRGGAVTGPTP